ncbi:MAG: hypothetical protein HY433_03565 [Candidatus Liptonbacteria bacterium]|nr:hypothetical protein [Candidatus Liptonbacteria bacterium]
MNKIPTKIATGILIMAVIALAITPIPAYAGGNGLSIIGIVLGIIVAILCYGTCIPLIVGALGITGAALATTVVVLTYVSYGITAAGLGFQSYATSSCSGNYDPVFGTCTTSKRLSQQIFTSTNAKFTGIDVNGAPSPEEFEGNPNVTATIKWEADAHPGLVNYLVVSDKNGGTGIPASAGPNGNVCSAGPQGNVFNSLSYGKTYVAEIWFASCFQIRGGNLTKNAVPTCSGCGYDAVGAKIEFTTPMLPPLGIDIKANGKDGGFAFVPGTPIVLSWTSQYATSCSAEGSWSGSKPTSGTETVTPKKGNEVYTIACTRPDGGMAQDSVSAAVSSPGFKISAPPPNGKSPDNADNAENGKKPFFKEVVP